MIVMCVVRSLTFIPETSINRSSQFRKGLLDYDIMEAKVKKVKLSHYRPLGFQEVETPRISKQSAHGGGKVVSPRHRPSLSPGKIPGSHFC